MQQKLSQFVISGHENEIFYNKKKHLLFTGIKPVYYKRYTKALRFVEI